LLFRLRKSSEGFLIHRNAAKLNQQRRQRLNDLDMRYTVARDNTITVLQVGFVVAERTPKEIG